MLEKRVISAAIVLPLVVTVFVMGGWPYVLLIVLAMLLGGLEYTRMFRRLGYAMSSPFLMLLILAWQADAIWTLGAWQLPLVTVLMLTVSLWALYQAKQKPDRHRAVELWALMLAGGMYLGLGGGYLIALRTRPDGLWWLLVTCGVVWIGDSAAYVVGRRIGRHKMAPTISPGKSWEGYAAQVLSGPISGLLLAWLSTQIAGTAHGLVLWHGLVLGLVVSVFCPAGDFLVSMMKREVGVKDTGSLIPGHGGVLDRVDSILWAGILGYMLATLLA